MSKTQFRVGRQGQDVLGQLFGDEVLELFEQVREGDYDERGDIKVSPELQAFLKTQGIGQVARSFRGSEKTTNPNDTVVVLMERLVRAEERQPRNYGDDEIVAGFWALTQGKEPPKQRLTTQEFREARALKQERRAEAAKEKAAKREQGGFAAQVQDERQADAGQSAGRF